MNLFIVLIVLVVMLLATFSYAKSQREKRKAAESYAASVRQQNQELAETINQLQQINKQAAENHAELASKPNDELAEHANSLFGPGSDDFLKSLKELRAESGLSVRKAASLSGISSTHFSAIENGKRKPSDETLENIKQVFAGAKKK